jgi:hypothetical protein
MTLSHTNMHLLACWMEIITPFGWQWLNHTKVILPHLITPCQPPFTLPSATRSSPTTQGDFTWIYWQMNDTAHVGMKIIHSSIFYMNAQVTKMPIGLPPKNWTGLIILLITFSQRLKMPAYSLTSSITDMQPSNCPLNWKPLLTMAEY